ncbi:hypothetical protein BJ166DRAFT_29030 [Pestalotiopsis sp. NC0098]|nr:hypothetical protein BJ166DRAFT_29030 [Pestalotiopsis sp. NC0098]
MGTVTLLYTTRFVPSWFALWATSCSTNRLVPTFWSILNVVRLADLAGLAGLAGLSVAAPSPQDSLAAHGIVNVAAADSKSPTARPVPILISRHDYYLLQAGLNPTLPLDHNPMEFCLLRSHVPLPTNNLCHAQATSVVLPLHNNLSEFCFPSGHSSLTGFSSPIHQTVTAPGQRGTTPLLQTQPEQYFNFSRCCRCTIISSICP